LISRAQNKFFTHGFQTDSADDSWKLAAVKDEVVDICMKNLMWMSKVRKING
jgi:hypothetical protein